MQIIRRMRFFTRSIISYTKYRMLRIFPNSGIRLNPFLSIILLTNRCNLRCSYCLETKERSKKDIPFRKLKEVLDECRRKSIPFISFSGGEPLLYPHFKKATDYANRHGFVLNLNTNGSLIHSRNARFIAKSFDYVRISLDGDERSHDRTCKVKGTFKRVVDGIKAMSKIKKRRAKIGINVVLHEKNIESIEKFIPRIRKYVDFIALLPEFNSFQHDYGVRIEKTTYLKKYLGVVSGLKSLKGNTDHFLKVKNLDKVKKDCLAGKLFWCIAWDGNVYSCPFHLENRPTYGYYDKEFSFDKLKYDNPTKHCHGCHSTCAIEISRAYGMPLPKILAKSFEFIRTFRL